MSEKTTKARQTYLDNIKAKTGKTAQELAAIAKKKGLSKSRQVVDWLKQEFDLGYGHSGMVWYMMAHAEDTKTAPTDRLARHFEGKKESWRKPYDGLAARIGKFGSDVEFLANMSYINVLRGEKKFAIVQVSSAERLDVGIKLKGVESEGRLEAAGSWNAMVTHRVRIAYPKEMDKELLGWLKQAYDAAGGKE